MGGVGLLIEELAADLMLPGQVGDRLSPSEHLDSQIPPCWGSSLWAGQRGRLGGSATGLRSDCVNEHENVAWASMPVSFVMMWV